MMRAPALPLLLLWCNLVLAQPVPDLLVGMGDMGPAELWGCAVDPTGHVYLGGHFAGTADLDPGQGQTLATSAGMADVCILKLDPNGDLLWVRRFGGTGPDFLFDLTLDPSGHPIVVGTFQDSARFDANGPWLVSRGANDAFILKLDPDGELLWALSWGASINDDARGVSTDATGAVYVTGGFNQTVDLDPGPGTFELTSAGTSDAYVLKLDAVGSFQWARRMGGPGIEQGEAVACNTEGRVVVTGRFAQSATFGPDEGTPPITSQGNADIFLMELQCDGTLEHLFGLGGEGFDSGYAIRMTSDGSILLGGSFSGTADLDPGANELLLTTGGQGQNAFLLKLDTDRVVQWARPLLSTEYSRVHDMAIDAVGQLHVGGAFHGTLDLDPGTGNASYTGQGFEDAILLTLDPTGSHVASGYVTTPGLARTLAVGIGPRGEVWYAGWFQQTAVVQHAANLPPITSGGANNMLLLRLDQCPQDPGTGTVYSSIDGVTLFVDDTADAYQWIDCSTELAIPGAEGPMFTATANGSYAVRLTFGPCVLTTPCQAVTTVGVNGPEPQRGPALYPNPTVDRTLLVAQHGLHRAEVRVLDAMGRVLRTFGPVQGDRAELDLDGLAPGMLWLEVRDATGTTTRLPLLKQ